jgi:hypothetical protein
MRRNLITLLSSNLKHARGFLAHILPKEIIITCKRIFMSWLVQLAQPFFGYIKFPQGVQNDHCFALIKSKLHKLYLNQLFPMYSGRHGQGGGLPKEEARGGRPGPAGVCVCVCVCVCRQHYVIHPHAPAHVYRTIEPVV